MPLPEGLNDFSLNGKRALVIGAEHPVGRTAAVTLVEAGARVLLASQEPGTEEALDLTAKAIHSAGQRNPPFRMQSAALRADISGTVDSTVRELGGLDIMVAALDKQFYGPIENIDDSVFDSVIQENFKSVWLACQEAGRVMLAHGGGVIVNITNVMAERGVPNAALYCAAKGAVRNLVGRWRSNGPAVISASICLNAAGWIPRTVQPRRKANSASG